MYAIRSYYDTDQYIAAFWEDAGALGLERPEDTPRATDDANMGAMVDLVQKLEARGP